MNDKDPWEFNHGGVWSPGLFGGQAPLYLNAVDYYTDPLNPLYITTSDEPFYAEEYSRTYSMKFDITSSRWPGHLVKSGLQIIYNDLEREFINFPAFERENRFTGEYSLGASDNIFHTFNPEASWYVQDRWEYEGMVVNYGLRWDMFSPGSAAKILLDNEDVDKNVIKYKHQFSPRRGFAFPMTVAFLVWYFLFVFAAVFAPDFMAQQVVGAINVGIIFGLLQFVSTGLITWAYVRHANRRLDPLAEEIREDMEGTVR